MSSTSLERFQSQVKSLVKSRILQELKNVRGIKNPIIIHVVKIKIALEEIQTTIKGIEAAIAATTIVIITTIGIVTITTTAIIQTIDAVLIVQIVTVMKIEFVQKNFLLTIQAVGTIRSF